jgi:hypothetical protein
MRSFIYAALLAFVRSEAEEPTYKIIESHTMESPITNKEFENFETKKASVFTKNNIILVPEI